ncbi:MAG TPA: VCBS repeat-containing protein, partial [Ignavibacteria bacterium]
MKKFVLLVFLSAFSVFSQNLHLRFEGIPVTIGGSPSNSPFSGGIDIPRYQFVDIDNDNDFDLFIFDKDTNLNYYKNEGSPSNSSFRLQTNKYFNLSFKNWFYFTDIDNDNDKDLFCGGDSQHVRYVKNIGSASNPAYQLQTYVLLTDQNQPLLSEGPCVPVYVDIDADGDIDFITGSSVGKLTYYKNIGNASNFNFQFVTAFFANLEIIGGGYDRHGASSITFDDIDGDNDRDLFWGDLFNPSVYFIRNTGTAQNFSFTVIDSTYPPPNAWFSGGFNMPRVHDIDNDGKKDLFVGVIIGSNSKNNFVYYRNTGTINNPQFTKVTENYIKAIDVGSSSFPCFADIDNDGDFDIFIGGDRPYISFFRNIGNAATPQFNLEIDSLAIPYFNFNVSPAIADLDNDGKKDLVYGAFDGKLRYYKNNGTVQNPVFTFTASQFDLIDVGQSSAPLLFDLDNDGDKDLLVGNSDGKLYYYVNNGTPTVFNFQLVTNNYQAIAVGNDSAPSLGDLDGDGDPDMLVGNRAGVINYYKNNGSIGNPIFAFVTNNYAGINVFFTSTPAIVDI